MAKETKSSKTERQKIARGELKNVRTAATEEELKKLMIKKGEKSKNATTRKGKETKQKTLEHFRNIILLSSPQDGYVPYHSARIESCQAAARDTSKKGKLFLEMLNACLDQLRANSMQHRVFMRCDVNFDASTQGKNLDSIIGRAAHVEFLDSDIFSRFIMWSFPDLFR